jgi:hypothetical protein
MAYLILVGNGFKLSLWTKPLNLLDCAFREAPGIKPGVNESPLSLDFLCFMSSEVVTSLAEV